MKYLIIIHCLIVLLLLNLSPVYGQNADTLNISSVKISGKVLGEKQKPLYGANIVIEGSIDGATSDSAGYFEFETTKTGRQILIATSIDYKEQSREIRLEPGKNIEINFQL
ncbi:MAG: carboxypeptidase-like regulatory domain-containing protein, partial [Ignavibacteria bacterium]